MDEKTQFFKCSQIDNSVKSDDVNEERIDPVLDIIEYLVRCVKISFKTARVDENNVRTSENISAAYKLYQQSPVDFLTQFGKFMTLHHIMYFQNLANDGDIEFTEIVNQLKNYHSDENKHKRIRNRRFKAMQKLQEETDYFSEKQMMYRNPLLYEQLVGQYLTDEEVRERDQVDHENLTFLNMILETVDRNQCREIKNVQMIEENLESCNLNEIDEAREVAKPKVQSQWGEFETPDTKPNYIPEVRKESMINAVERRMLRSEFLQEMCNSFINGQDEDVDYESIDNDEQYDDLNQASLDAEEKYFESESNDIRNLEEHMKLVQEYGRKGSDDCIDDPLDVFMEHINKKLTQ